eukprot:scaffold41956_cov51-Attheya_sp.AAC.2
MVGPHHDGEGDADTMTSRAVLVEEEPPHEFYASLFGKTASSAKRLSSWPRLPAASTPSRSTAPEWSQASASTSHAGLAADESCASVVQEDEEEDNEIGMNKSCDASEFSQVYKKAMADPPKLSSLSLNGSNRGFQMLRNMGWREEEGGLGRTRQGTLAPVATCFQADRKGLGVAPLKRRVTHNPPAPAKDPKPQENKADRRCRRKEELETEKRRAKRARMLLRTDISDEYEQLYMELHR